MPRGQQLRGSVAAGSRRRDTKCLKISGLVTTCCKEAVILSGEGQREGTFCKSKGAYGHLGNVFTAKVKCFGVPAVCRAPRAARDAGCGVGSQPGCCWTRINPGPEQEAERGAELPRAASLSSVAPSWAGSSAALLAALAPSIVPRHRNLEVLKEEKKKKKKLLHSGKNSIAHSAVKLLVQEV